MVSANAQMRLRICEGSPSIVRVVSQSRVKKFGRVSVLRLVKVPLYSFNFVDGDPFYAGSGWSDEGMDSISAVITVMYHAHFVKKRNSLLDAIYFFHYFKPRSPRLSSASTCREHQSVLDKTFGNILSAEGDGTEDRAAPRKSSSEDGAARAAPAGCSRQRASKTNTKRPGRKLERSRVLA